MKIAVLGAGMLARSLMDRFADLERMGRLGDGYAVMLGHDEFDIRDHDSIVKALIPHKPDVIVNTVAIHALGACEANPGLTYEVNARGAERVANLVRTIYISTDYVFGDGGPHEEVMPGRQPTSIYGRSKLAGELATLEKDGIVVRVAGLFGDYPSHKGPSFPERVLTTWGSAEFPSDQRFSPTYATDAAIAIADLALDPDAKGIYHAVNSGSTTWAEFAREVCIITKHRLKVKGVAAHDPLRPRDGRLASVRLPAARHWRWALEAWWKRRQERLREESVSPLREGVAR